MKRYLYVLITALAVLLAAQTGWALTIKGELIKIDGEFYVIKDKDGKEYKIHFDRTTKKEGDVKEGAPVEVDESDGHAKSIKVVETTKK